MADQTERIIIEIDGSSVKGEAQQVERAINTIGDAADKAGKKVTTAEKGMDDLAKSLKTVGAGAKLSEKQMDSLQRRIANTSAARAQADALKQIASAANLSVKATETLGRRMGVTASEIDKITGASKRASTAVREIGTSSQRSAASMAMLTNAAGAFGVALSVAGLVQFGDAVIKAGIAMDALQRSFVAITGSQTAAAQELRFLREEADRLGQSFFDLAPIYKDISAAARGTALEGEAVRKVFSSITEASSALGMSTADTEGALRALSQMISKGTVQAEELRGQLGERLPGAFQLMAKALGVTTAELNKMLEQGQVLAEDALPKLAAEISKMYGAAAETAALESAQAAVNRLSQAWTEFKINLFDNKAAVNGINAITSALKTLTEYAGLRSVSDTFAQGADLADKGLIDFDVFKAAGYLERQRMVDEFVNSQQVAAKNFTATWAAAEKQSLESFKRYNERKLEVETSAAKQRSDTAKKANDELRKLTQTAMEKLAERRDKFIADGADRAKVEAWYTGEVAKLNEKATKKFTDEQNKQLAAHKKAREAMLAGGKAAEDAIADYWDQYEKRRIDAIAESTAKTVKMRVDAEKEAADAATAILEKQQADAQKVMDNIQDATADVFYDLFNNIEDGWSNLWDSMKAWALRTLAELAARAATVQIVVPIMMSMTGTANATQAVQSLTGGNGGFDLSSLSSLVQPGSMLSKIPGMSTVTGLLGTTLPGTATALSGVFSGVGASAGMYATGLGFTPGMVANGALQGMTLGGQPLATAAPAMTAGGLSIGAALGMGALGGLGYSLLGGPLGLPQNQYTGVTSSLGGALGAWGGTALAGTSAGAALGATAGSVVPIIGTAVGAILGGLAGGLFGDDKNSPSVIFQGQDIAWGQTDGYQFHTKDGGSNTLGNELSAALGQYAGTMFTSLESVLSGMGEKYVDMLQDQTVTFGRKTGGSWTSWDFGADHDIEELFAKAQADLSGKILAAASGAFQAAGQDIASSDDAMGALGMLSEKAAEQFKALQDVIAAGVQSGNVEAYIAQLQSFQATVQTINATWDAVNQAADDLVKPPTAYESAVRQANAQFDEWVGTLSALGFAQGKIEELEAKRAATLARLNAEMGPLAEAEAARASALAEAERAVETARGNLRAAYQREAAEIEATAKKWDSFAASLKKWRDDIMAGPMSPIPASSQADLAASRYQDVLNRAKLGDEEAIAELQDVAGQQLTVAKDTAATAEDYARSALRTLNEVRSVEDVATRHADIARQQLDALTQQVSSLITINGSVLSVADAIRALQSAMASQATVSSGGGATESGYPEIDNTAGFNTVQYLYNKTEQVNLIGYQGRTDWTVQQVQQAMADAGMTPWEHFIKYGIAEGVRGYASGGMHPGGLRLVGEKGPELEVTGPARIWSAEDTKRLLSGGDDGTASEVRALRDDLRAIGRALAKNMADTAKLMQRWDGDGMPEVRAA